MPKIGYKQTKEHKKKRQESQMLFYFNGGIGGFKNKKHTVEALDKIRKSLIGNTRHLGHSHSKQVRQKIREKMLGRKLSKQHRINIGKGQIGRVSPMKGKHHSIKSRKKTSEKLSGSNNPMFGKPSPKGSGRGWSGYLDGVYFRSLLELSYLYYLIENNIKFENAEKRKYKVSYVDAKNIDRTYYADYIMNNEMIEVKPTFAIKFERTQEKIKAAEKWCEKNDMSYKIITPETLEKSIIVDLVNNDRIKWTDRTKEKYNKY